MRKAAQAARFDTDQGKEVGGAGHRRFLVQTLMGQDGVDDLVAQGHHRIERIHRTLEHDGGAAPAELLQLGGGEIVQVLAGEADVPPADAAGLLDQPQDRVGHGTLATAGLAGQAEDLALAQGEADVVDGTGGPARREILDHEMLHLQQRRAGGRRGHGRTHRATCLRYCLATLIVRRRGLLIASIP
jgi:hypothetical protein